MTVLAYDAYKDNSDLIVACVLLDYLKRDWLTLDPTYGEGTFWKTWRPENLTTSDLVVKPGCKYGADFTNLPWGDDTFDAVVFDPPYKLNGTPDPEVDGRYGVHINSTWQDRMQLCRDGLIECIRVFNGNGFLLMKCQDQVVSGKVRWQTHDFTLHAQRQGLDLVDALHFASYRPQPNGRRQVHARRNYSTMLVFK